MSTKMGRPARESCVWRTSIDRKWTDQGLRGRQNLIGFKRTAGAPEGSWKGESSEEDFRAVCCLPGRRENVEPERLVRR